MLSLVYNLLMKAYFTASVVGKIEYLKEYKKILGLLENRGYKVYGDHILEGTEDKIRLESREGVLAFHRKLERWISLAEFVVV